MIPCLVKILGFVLILEKLVVKYFESKIESLFNVKNLKFKIVLYVHPISPVNVWSFELLRYLK